MLGHPASSQTVCRPSRRTSDFSSVYSGPVRSLVLIHSGLRSMGVWLLRTSRRSSLRPAGSIPEADCGVPAGASSMPRLMASTLPPRGRAPRAPTWRGGPAGAAGPPRRAAAERSVLVGLRRDTAAGQRGAGGPAGAVGRVGGVAVRVDPAGALLHVGGAGGGDGGVRVVVAAGERLRRRQVALVLRAGGR